MWLRWCSALVMALAVTACGGGSSHPGSTSQGSAESSTVTTTSSNGGGAQASAPDNGAASRSPEQLVTLASRTLDGAGSVHVVGSVVDNGIPVALNLHLSSHHGGEGVVSENGFGFRMIATGRVLYIQGSEAFWEHFGGAGAAQLFRGKWLKVPNSGQFATLGRLASIPGLVGQLLAEHGRLRSTGRATIAGQPAVGVTDRTKGGTLYVASTGRPYPLEIVKRGRDGGYVKFTGFNQPISIRAPTRWINLPGSS